MHWTIHANVLGSRTLLWSFFTLFCTDILETKWQRTRKIKNEKVIFYLQPELCYHLIGCSLTWYVSGLIQHRAVVSRLKCHRENWASSTSTVRLCEDLRSRTVCVSFYKVFIILPLTISSFHLLLDLLSCQWDCMETTLYIYRINQMNQRSWWQ